MRTATLTRTETGDEGTFGTLVTDSGFTCVTGELPWRDNESGRSCIPPGTYTCVFRESPSKGMCYHVENVPERTNVLIHSANWMGDVDKGFVSQLEGCIAPGERVDQLEGQKGVVASKAALQALEDDLNRETFELTIV